jgi:DNA topoisomerase-3
MKILILTEKPSQARDFAKALGNCKQKEGYYDCGKYIITWAVGHLFEIDDSVAPKKWSLETLPIYPEKFKLKLRRGGGKQFKVIKKLLKNCNSALLATDPGREGELIAREILQMAGWKNWDKTYRFWTSEAITPEVIRKHLKNLKPAREFDSLYYSALARQHADWVVGINFTRLATLKSNSGDVWSVGRVQTPTLRLIVEREEEIKNFQPEEYFVIKATFQKEDKNYEGILIRDKSLIEKLLKEDIKNLEPLEDD